jgi:site-specific recombinase XerD
VTFEAATERFLAVAGISDGTRRAYGADLREFGRWFGPDSPIDDIDIRVLADWVSELGRAREHGKLAPATIGRKLASVRSLLRFTRGPGYVPDASLAPRRPRRLPDAPKQREVEDIVDALGGNTALTLRNQALVELVYSAGLRSAEAVGLDLGDVDFEQEHVHVRLGKGAKDRVVPLGEEAAHLVTKRARNSRPEPRTPSSSRCAATASIPRRSAGSSPTRTGCATRSRRTCSKAAPTCARSRSCWATRRSRPPRCTATSMPSD